MTTGIPVSKVLIKTMKCMASGNSLEKMDL